MIHLDHDGQVVIAGDIHGNRENLNRIIKYTRTLGQDTILVLQEIIHGETDKRTGTDRSIEVMNRAARLKINNPHGVFMLMGNHDLAQFSRGEIAKNGRGACEEFRRSAGVTFGDNSDDVLNAVEEFCRSLPLAIRFKNGVLASHTLPSPASAHATDIDILSRQYTDRDCLRHGALYDWTWGRNQNPEQLESLATQLNASFFILGHRHVYDGYVKIPPSAISLDSCQHTGCVFQFKGDDVINMDNAAEHIHRIATL